MTPAIRNTSRTVPAARASAHSREQRDQQQHELDAARDDERRGLDAGRRRVARGVQRRLAGRRARSSGRLVLGHGPIIVSRPVAILFVGDVVGATGRRLLLALLPELRERHAIDFVVVNGENAANGVGITPKIADALFAAGVDVDHARQPHLPPARDLPATSTSTSGSCGRRTSSEASRATAAASSSATACGSAS